MSERLRKDAEGQRKRKCPVCGCSVETDIVPLNACSEHKAKVAKMNKEKMANVRARKGGE